MKTGSQIAEELNFHRLARQVSFVLEIEKLKNILRQTWVVGMERQENSAEHSWHLALMVGLLAEYAANPTQLDQLKAMKMALVHDLVEIDAGDTFCYDEALHHDKAQRESLAAKRLFDLLPNEQANELRSLWNEYEDNQSPEAQFVHALDCLQPVLLNYLNKGGSWQKHGIKKPQVTKRISKIALGSPTLHKFASELLNEASRSGVLPEA